MPELRFQMPELSFQIPKLHFQMSELHFQMPERRFQMSKLSFQMPKLSFQMPELRFQMPKLSFQMPKLHFQKPELHFQMPERRFQVFSLFFRFIIPIVYISVNFLLVTKILRSNISTTRHSFARSAQVLFQSAEKTTKTLADVKIRNVDLLKTFHLKLTWLKTPRNCLVQRWRV